MPLAPGVRLGPYEISGVIGAGGMGEVYKARDTRLGRVVAIKVLPESFAADPQFRERLDREARMLSGLDHPHICALYDVGHEQGTLFLVMPFLEGETLAARLERGPLPLDQALAVAAQITDGLDKAHTTGIVHRDLKPANVMLSKSGARLLDFGLAKTTAPVLAPNASMPTLQRGLTAEGSILGTLQYMAPEQVEGRNADARTDIFAFGVLLYEMVAGRKPFDGASQASLIAAILEREPPPLSSVQPVAPPALDRLVRKCLAKDPDDRWQSARDLRDELRWIAASPAPERGSEAAAGGRRAPLWLWLLTGVSMSVAILAITLAWPYSTMNPAVQNGAVVATYDLPQRLAFPETASAGRFAVSPNGRRLAFVGQDSSGGTRRVWVRPLDSADAVPLPRTEGAQSVFWSPDSRTIAFVANGRLERISVAGGVPAPIADQASAFRGDWSRDDVILFQGQRAGPLLRVPALGRGAPVAVTTLDAVTGLKGLPSFLPDGRHFLFAAGLAMNQSRAVFLGSLDGTAPKLLVPRAAFSAYASGHLLYTVDSTLMAQAFDPDRGALIGEPIAIVEDLEIGPGRSAAFSVSANGVLAYVQTTGHNPRSQLQIVDRAGTVVSTLGDPADQIAVRVSPDGARAVASILDPVQGTRDLWIYDLHRPGVRTLYTSDPGEEIHAVWSPDGSELAYSAARVGSLDVFRRSVSGSGQSALLVESGFNKYVTSWSPDGRTLLYFTGTGGSGTLQDIWKLPLTAGASPSPFLKTKFGEYLGRFSPVDGRWIAFTSTESGRSETYIIPAAGGDKIPVSVGGGAEPCWSSDGRELFFVSPTRQLMAVDVRFEGTTPRLGEPHTLFDLHIRSGDYMGYYAGSPYDAMRDGRFLVNTVPETGGRNSITLVVNWPALMNK